MSLTNSIIMGKKVGSNYGSIALSSDGTKGIAGSLVNEQDYNQGIYFTNNSGTNWTQSNINTGYFQTSLSSDGTKIIVASSDGIANRGIYYGIYEICYDKKTLILINKKGVDIYKRISELKVGDLVKTYKDDYKKIKMIKSFKHNCFNIPELKKCLYKMKNHNIIVTGKHGILVDEVTPEELNKAKICGVNIRSIKDKKVVPACASNKFKRITEDKLFELWHFVLENNNIHKNYGIYITDGILSESCSEEAFSNISF
jgi:hypothetical protein